MKSQITVENSKHQIPNHKFEIQNLKRFWSFGHCILEFICNLYFVIWNFKRFGNWNLFGILDLNFGISRIGHWYLFVICILLFGIFGINDASAAVSNLGLVGYWSMNEGTGSYAGDASGNKNTGTLTNGPTWVDGKRGKALNFDGSNDYVEMGNVLNPTTNMTLVAWFNIKSFAGINYLISRDNGTTATRRDYSLDVANSTTLRYSYDDTATNPTNKDVTVQTLNTNQWYHFVIVLDSGNNAMFYLNGVSVGSATAATHVGQTTNSFHIGRSHNTSSGSQIYTNSLIDEVRVYNRALSAAEVQALYKSGAQKFTAPPTNLGLVGYWSMNEGAGTVAGDGSGNGNRGILTNGPTWVDGKRGKAINFDGGDDYVDASLVSSKTNNFSFAFWLKVEVTSDTRGTVFFNGSGTNGYGFVAGSTDGGNTATFFFLAQSIYWLNTSVGWTPNAWQHIVGTLDASNVWRLYRNGNLVFTSVAQSALNTPTIRTTLGAESSGGSSIAHSFDEVRVYNRALSAAEIQALYNSGAQKFTAPPTNLGLVGYWSMNEGTGTVAGDGSGNGNRGTLTGGPTWVDGKRGKALSFDGGDDKVNAGTGSSLNVTGAFTASAWIYPRSYGGASKGRIIQKGDLTSTGFIWFVDNSNTTNGMSFCTNGCSGGQLGNIITLNQWQHVTVVWNGASIATFYVNGVSKGNASSVTSGSISSHLSSPLSIGANAADTTRQFNGLIDEVRIYNRELTASEIQALYKSGAGRIGL